MRGRITFDILTDVSIRCNTKRRKLSTAYARQLDKLRVNDNNDGITVVLLHMIIFDVEKRSEAKAKIKMSIHGKNC